MSQPHHMGVKDREPRKDDKRLFKRISHLIVEVAVVIEGEGSLKKLIMHPAFRDTVREIDRLNIMIPETPVPEEFDLGSYIYQSDDAEIACDIEPFGVFELDPEVGQRLAASSVPICAYDESINKFQALEGTAYLMCHSFVVLAKNDYLPFCYLTIYFYTRSETLAKDSKFVKQSEDHESSSKSDYAKDRTEFLVGSTPEGSIVFIDGPLLGKQLSGYTRTMNRKLLENNVIPIFFVKNSASNLVTEKRKELKGIFNSDMHWAYKKLKLGQRTNFFPYRDPGNPKENSKYFCYLKSFDSSPQRVEFHEETVNRFGKDRMVDIMNLVHYLMWVQGNVNNPQMRPIAIAERFARETLKLIDLSKMIRQSGLVSTVNQRRFGRD